MNHHQHQVLHALFAHPVSANIGFRDVMHMFEVLGAVIENKSGRRIGVRLNGRMGGPRRRAATPLLAQRKLGIRREIEAFNIEGWQFASVPAFKGAISSALLLDGDQGRRLGKMIWLRLPCGEAS